MLVVKNLYVHIGEIILKVQMDLFGWLIVPIEEDWMIVKRNSSLCYWKRLISNIILTALWKITPYHIADSLSSLKRNTGTSLEFSLTTFLIPRGTRSLPKCPQPDPSIY